ncbi:peroxisome- protein [Irineochytrium annulatum]|nr:peroxisome- protein [Irineochytrium annulatum]
MKRSQPPGGPGGQGSSGSPGPGGGAQPLSVMLASLQSLVGRVNPMITPLLHWATYVSTWQDRSSSLVVSAIWCLLCLAPRFCLVYGPHAVVLMIMGFHYSEKMKNPKGKTNQPRVPPLPKLVRFITRILNDVHSRLDQFDLTMNRLSWKTPETESIQLFQTILMSYAAWIIVNAILPLNVIIMLTGLVIIGWYSDVGEMVREVVAAEWEKARGRTPAATTTPAAITVGASAGVVSVGKVAVVAANATLTPTTDTPAQSVGTVNFGNFQATVTLEPVPAPPAPTKEDEHLRKAEVEAQKAAEAALEAQREAARAEEVAIAAVAASEVAAAVAHESVSNAASPRSIKDASEGVTEGSTDSLTAAVEAAAASITARVVAEDAAQTEEPVTVNDVTADAETKTITEAEAKGGAEVAVVEGAVEVSPDAPVELKEAVAEPSTSTTSTPDAVPSVTTTTAPTVTTATPVVPEEDPAVASANRLQQRLAELAKKRLREAAAAKSAAAAATQLAVERLAAVKAATPEPREEDLNRRQRPSSMISIGSNGTSSQFNHPHHQSITPSPLTAALLAAATGTTPTLAHPARTSSRAHSQQQQQRGSTDFSSGLRNRRSYGSNTGSEVSALRKIDAALALAERIEAGEVPSKVRVGKQDDQRATSPSDDGATTVVDSSGHRTAAHAAKEERPAFRQYGSLRLSDDEDEEDDDPDADGQSAYTYEDDTGTVILHDDTDSYISGYTNNSSLPRSHRTGTPTANHRRPTSMVTSTTRDEYDDYDDEFDDEDDDDDDAHTHRGPRFPIPLDDPQQQASLAALLRNRRRSLDSNYTLERSKTHNTHPPGHGGLASADASTRPSLPRPLQIPAYVDPFATKAEQQHRAQSIISGLSNAARTPTTPGGGSSIMSRSSMRWTNRKPLDVVLSFECYENQRWWVGLGWVAHLLPAERPPWTDFQGSRSTPRESFELLPFRREQLLSWRAEVALESNKRYAWEWDGAWYVDTKGGAQIGEVDEEGWAYADNFWKDWKNRKTLKRVVRHRRWVRHARLFELGAKQNVKFSSSDSLGEGDEEFNDAEDYF